MLALFAVTILTREPDPGELRLGQRVYVDDGTCPAGQIKEVAGANLTASGSCARGSASHATASNVNELAARR